MGEYLQSSDTFLKDLMETVAKVQKEIDEIFRDFWTKHYKFYPDSYRYLEPPYDIVDAGDRIIVTVDVPGFKKSEIKIRVTEDTLEVIAEKSSERIADEEKKNYIVRQRVYRKLYKKIELPYKVRPEQAKAKLEDGVLIVSIPKSEARREVEINVE